MGLLLNCVFLQRDISEPVDRRSFSCVTASSIIWAREEITGAALTMVSLGEVSKGFQRSLYIYKKLILSLRKSSSSSYFLRDRPNSIRIAFDYVLPYTSSTASVCLCRYNFFIGLMSSKLTFFATQRNTTYYLHRIKSSTSLSSSFAEE